MCSQGGGGAGLTGHLASPALGAPHALRLLSSLFLPPNLLGPPLLLLWGAQLKPPAEGASQREIPVLGAYIAALRTSVRAPFSEL